jgi:hypothetical protein
MPNKPMNRLYELQYELQLAQLHSHETHMKHIYGIRRIGLGIAALAILIGAVMVFAGLQGSFNWAVEAPQSISAKLTNASPGIIFATVGLIIAFVVALQKPVSSRTGGANLDGWRPVEGLDKDAYEQILSAPTHGIELGVGGFQIGVGHHFELSDRADELHEK